MILKASQRGGGAQLARHLLNESDNDHVQVHELRGFVASDLHGAFKEAHAISRGTRCKQFLFSLSLSPPETAKVPIEAFEKAIAIIEAKVGLSGQPRAIVFHEKEGRRHAHCVWSRIDASAMKAINLPHFKLKLQDISRQLYMEHDWKMPQGLVSRNQCNPLNFTLAEWQQAKRARKDPRAIKQTIQDCWAVSDSLKGFAGALNERGFYLAKGDRRGFVALDWHGEVYSIARMIGRKTRKSLPSWALQTIYHRSMSCGRGSRKNIPASSNPSPMRSQANTTSCWKNLPPNGGLWWINNARYAKACTCIKKAGGRRKTPPDRRACREASKRCCFGLLAATRRSKTRMRLRRRSAKFVTELKCKPLLNISLRRAESFRMKSA
ncbi:relaxase/mobilization nuclease domain-containing protein [Hoeflea sp.]|uniref:relaxase/mobilization nuclease domain-containing protein n=1 Tax=Hoeflea sp. TaxID=1940281 RepID=UPI003B518D88